MSDALGGQAELVPDASVESVADKVRAKGSPLAPEGSAHERTLISVLIDKVGTEAPREAGPVHVGHQMWRKLGLDEILAASGMSGRARLLTEVMVLNRLVAPTSEHAMPDWIRRTALADILATDFSTLSDETLYEHLDRLHPRREKIEGALAERERTLFNLEDTLYLYDLTSTYFEGQCPLNPQAKRGYSRDGRPDCKQVVVGLVLNKDGFPKAHEVFDGNRTDRTTVDEMLDTLEKRTGKKSGCTVIVDRGMAFDDNLEQIKKRHYHYLVASRQGERDEHLQDFEEEEGWTEVVREPSPTNPGQRKTTVLVRKKLTESELHVLCWSEGRVQKDRAIREKHEKRLLADLEKLQKRVASGKLSKEAKINEAIGRLKERYSRVARYYEVAFEAEPRRLTWRENVERKRKAETLDGTYLLKTDRMDMKDEEVWRTYVLLTRVESAFRSMKSPLMERPIFHHLKHRVQTHIFLCVLAYHLLASVEKCLRDRAIHTSWETVRQQLSTHQVVTVVLPANTGEVLRIRKGSTPESIHRELYGALRIPEEVMTPVLTWSPA
jgi:transposase